MPYGCLCAIQEELSFSDLSFPHKLYLQEDLSRDRNMSGDVTVLFLFHMEGRDGAISSTIAVSPQCFFFYCIFFITSRPSVQYGRFKIYVNRDGGVIFVGTPICAYLHEIETRRGGKKGARFKGLPQPLTCADQPQPNPGRLLCRDTDAYIPFWHGPKELYYSITRNPDSTVLGSSLRPRYVIRDYSQRR